MGYRSDVTCIMYTNDPKDKGAGAIMTTWLKQRIHDDDMQCFEFHDTEVIFIAEDWKWYESYTDIQRLEKLFTDFQETFCAERHDSKYGYEFIRVGEDYHDVDHYEAGVCAGRLSLSRCIRIEGIDD
jgi:hypothetical protein